MRAGVVGGGSWGTALGCLLARKGVQTRLWARDGEALARMTGSRTNERYLPGVVFPESLELTGRLEDVAEGTVVLCVPTRAQRELARRLAGLGRSRAVLCAAKGYEPETRKRMSEVLREELGKDACVAVLAGPSHAEEVARSIPTSVVVASEDEACARHFQELLLDATFRVYTNPDLLGVETAAALKNVIAIAAGVCDGLGFGDNTKGALLTRGLAELSRLGRALGARPETFSGLAGIGDLVTTCTSVHSRNRRLGELVARGVPLEDACARIGMAVEGIGTTRSALAIAATSGVELPITQQVAHVLFEGREPRKALGELMTRDAKAEVR
ncbi:MAG: NAD(P)H-dependent glycerol-3-phosphate dehydrogenase [bacterium]